jgi:hypothetical protein
VKRVSWPPQPGITVIQESAICNPKDVAAVPEVGVTGGAGFKTKNRKRGTLRRDISNHSFQHTDKKLF